MSEVKRTEEEITREGNPRKPQGEEGKVMLDRMNHSHYEVTGWALAHWKIKGDDQILDIGCGKRSENMFPRGGGRDYSASMARAARSSERVMPKRASASELMYRRGLFWCVC